MLFILNFTIFGYVVHMDNLLQIFINSSIPILSNQYSKKFNFRLRDAPACIGSNFTGSIS